MTATPYPATQVAGLIEQAIAGSRRSRAAATRRHPAEVTADRLLDALERWPDAWDGADRDAVAQVRQVLFEIAEGQR